MAITEHFYIASHLVHVLLRYVKKEGIDDKALLQKLKKYAKKSHGTLTSNQWFEVLHEINCYAKNPVLGLDLGFSIELEDCGVLGYLSANCETHGEALICFKRYQYLLYSRGIADVTLENDRVLLKWENFESSFTPYISDEFLLAGLLKFYMLIGVPLEKYNVKAGFKHTLQINEDEPFLNLIKEIQHNCPALYVSFDSALLQYPIKNSNQGLKKLLDEQAKTLMSTVLKQNDYINTIQKALVSNMQHGLCSMQALASKLNISERTLRRHLQKNGIGFTQLLEQTRKSLAIKYIKDKKLSHTEIALLLGYSEQSAFSRAFKKWTGYSPSKYVMEEKTWDNLNKDAAY